MSSKPTSITPLPGTPTPAVKRPPNSSTNPAKTPPDFTDKAMHLEARILEAEALNRAMLNLLDDLQAANHKLARTSTQLEATNRELEAFSYSVSHDLRAPLRAIDGFAAALAEDYGTQLDPVATDYLHRIIEATHRMQRLINDLLKLSRVTRKDMHIEDVDLSTMAQTILEELATASPKRRVLTRVEPNLLAAGDPSLLRIVMENLLSNAWKFTTATSSAQIEFGRQHENGCHAFFVRDNGAGFDMAHVADLFVVFQRLHKQSEFDGTGVGLATVRRIVNRHGGRIWAKGEIGKGATFFFVLPSPVEHE